MIEEIVSTVGRYMEERIKLSKGAMVLIAAGSFVFGLVTGVCAAKLTLSKKIRVGYSDGSDFDADEYVRNLNFDDEN